MSKEAMTLALEALESLKVTVSSRTEANVIDGVDLFPKQMAALREALANEALDKMAENAKELGLDYEPAQKPQRWAVFCQGCRKEWSVSYPHPGKDICVDCDDKPAQQEPVAWMFQHGETGRTLCVDAQQVKWGFEERNPRYQKIAPLYTSPPAQRTWVGLSDLNIDELENEYMKSAQTAHEFLRAIEAKLKEKNT